MGRHSPVKEKIKNIKNATKLKIFSELNLFFRTFELLSWLLQNIFRNFGTISSMLRKDIK